jgi:hypothetical protein
MEWLIHVGSEKTGSSHLQAILANSRVGLSTHGVSFPKGSAHDERCMRQGAISAGNARLLAWALREGDDSAARKEVEKLDAFSRGEGAQRVVVTSELLLAALAFPHALERLLVFLQEKGASAVSFLLVLRDPLDQCLSLYKHRAKYGSAGDIESWVVDGYSLPQDLVNFRAEMDGRQCRLVVRKYRRGAGLLEKMFFGDWLGVPPPGSDRAAVVNPSLSLTELIIIRQMAACRPDLVPFLYGRLVAVPGAEKAQSGSLEDYARLVAADAVAAHSLEWVAWNERLPADEQLDIPDKPELIPPVPTELRLTARQMQAITELISDATTASFKSKLFWQSRLRPLLSSLKHRVMGATAIRRKHSR